MDLSVQHCLSIMTEMQKTQQLFSPHLYISPISIQFQSPVVFLESLDLFFHTAFPKNFFQYLQRRASAPGYMSLPVEARVCRPKALSFFSSGCHQETWPRFRVGLPASNNLSQKIPVGAGEMAQYLRSLDAFPKNFLHPQDNKTCLVFLVPRGHIACLCPPWISGTHMVHSHM